MSPLPTFLICCKLKPVCSIWARAATTTPASAPMNLPAKPLRASAYAAPGASDHRVFLSEIRCTWQSAEELRHLRRISFLLDDRQDGSNCGFGGQRINFRSLSDLVHK